MHPLQKKRRSCDDRDTHQNDDCSRSNEGVQQTALQGQPAATGKRTVIFKTKTPSTDFPTLHAVSLKFLSITRTQKNGLQNVCKQSKATQMRWGPPVPQTVCCGSMRDEHVRYSLARCSVTSGSGETHWHCYDKSWEPCTGDKTQRHVGMWIFWFKCKHVHVWVKQSKGTRGKPEGTKLLLWMLGLEFRTGFAIVWLLTQRRQHVRLREPERFSSE